MDINSLLSPQDSPASETPPPISSPQPQPQPPPHKQRPGRPASGKRKSSGLSQHVNAYSPPPQLPPAAQPQQQQFPQLPTPTSSYNPAVTSYLQHGSVPSPGPAAVQNGRGPSCELRSPLTNIAGARTPPAARPQQQPAVHRHGSTPGMDTLADLASMQHHQQTARQNSTGLRSPQVYQRAPSVGYTIHSIARTMSSNSTKDMNMADAPASNPRVFSAGSLSPADNQTVTELVARLDDNAYDFLSAVRLVELLHKGLRDHVNPPDTPDVTRDPHTYELLSDLHRARQSMQAKFAMGEDGWVAWINDEELLAQNTEDRLSVMELCSKAVQEEPSSSALWRLYGDYMHYLWTAAFDIEPADWSEEDKIVGRDVFLWQPMENVWDQGLAATQWHINDSNLVWDRWMEIMLADQESHPDPQKLQHLKSAFIERLLKPHATWDNTFQMFSTFISKYHNTEYEETMATMNKRAAHAKQQYSYREQFETNIDKAVKAGDKDAEWEAYTQYLEWELRHKGVFSFHLINALYERATLRFSTDPTVWEDYVQVLMENPNSGVAVLPVIERATRHCPWSGNLWSHRLLTLEAEGRSFDEMESVKHSATETGLLDVGGMEQLLQVYIAWCGFLRRKAFDVHSTEDDIDIAEVGIRSALEHVKEIGEQRFGKEFTGDPQYRLERIHIKFVTQMGSIEAAREFWRSLIPRQENSYDFWYRYYIWEMILWSKFVVRDKENAGKQLETPREATNLLRQALKRISTMDWPEQLTQMFLNHCEQHESVQEYRFAIIEARKANREVAARRQKEAAEAAAAYQQQLAGALEAMPTTEDPSAGGKRKRASDATAEESAAKKSKQGKANTESMELEGSPSAQLKRDREHTTVIVKNIPADASETKVRQFFRDCGKLNSLKLVDEKDGSSRTATIEFETPTDAQFAQSRDGKNFDGNTITVSIGAGVTLWVTNYPPEADEMYIRKIFEPHGEVVDVRFPSLKYNTHRRFCYVSFISPEQAQAASKALDNTPLGGKFTLAAKVSNPSHAAARVGAMYEGREVFVGNLANKAKEEDIQKLFSELEGVQNVRIPSNVAGKNKGVAFIEFDTHEDAAKAVDVLNLKEFKGRIMRVSISEPKGAKRHATTIIGQTSASPEPSSIGDNDSEAATHNGTIAPKASGNETASHYRERTIALLNIPDTVNDARIRAIAEPYGPLVKIVLMPEHQGALVEYQHIRDVGKASLCLEGTEIVPGRKMRVGTYGDLKRTGAEKKVDRLGAGGPAGTKKGKEGAKSDEKTQPTSAVQLAPRISRPGQPGARRGGKGGLGTKRGGVGLSVLRATSDGHGKDVEMGGTSVAGGAKSNADFKAMFLTSRDKPKEGDGDEGNKESKGGEA